MLELSCRYGSGPVPVEEIATSRGISGHYIHLLAPALRQAGLVRAARGPHGGYRLSRPPAEITLLEVVEAVEGRNAPVECVADELSCEQSGFCVAREVWAAVASAVDGVLRSITLEGLAVRERDRSSAGTWQI